MKLTLVQKRIILTVLGFVLGFRACRYSYLKFVEKESFLVFFNLLYFSYLVIFLVSLLIIISSFFGMFRIGKEIIREYNQEVVSERFIKKIKTLFWTFFFSLIFALIVKVLIWP